MPDAFSNILLSEGLVSTDQLAEAMRIAASSGKKVHDEVVRLGYAPGDKVMKALAKAFHLKFVDLTGLEVPGDVVALLPESVARENSIFPLAAEGSSLRVATCDPTDLDTQEKLRFILNREVELALAPREQIVEAINRHYGMSDGESADSMLQEFTDTAIDFTETAVEQAAAAAQEETSDAPVVKLVNLISFSRFRASTSADVKLPRLLSKGEIPTTKARSRDSLSKVMMSGSTLLCCGWASIQPPSFLARFSLTPMMYWPSRCRTMGRSKGEDAPEQDRKRGGREGREGSEWVG
jgi:hypothetical protein